jgi:hypothetical protein
MLCELFGGACLCLQGGRAGPQGNEWCAHREGETMNGALSEPVGTQWSEGAVFRECQDGKLETKTQK